MALVYIVPRNALIFGKFDECLLVLLLGILDRGGNKDTHAPIGLLL